MIILVNPFFLLFKPKETGNEYKEPEKFRTTKTIVIVINIIGRATIHSSWCSNESNNASNIFSRPVVG